MSPALPAGTPLTGGPCALTTTTATPSTACGPRPRGSTTRRRRSPPAPRPTGSGTPSAPPGSPSSALDRQRRRRRRAAAQPRRPRPRGRSDRRRCTTSSPRGGGRPLEPEVRTDMEARLGHDFGDVRVHDGCRGPRLGEGGAAPTRTRSGRTSSSSATPTTRARTPAGSTLAHELTHVVQQRNGPVDGTPAAGGIRVSDPATGSSARRPRTPSGRWPAPATTAAPGRGTGRRPAAGRQREAEEEEEASRARSRPAAVQREAEEEVGRTGVVIPPARGPTSRFRPMGYRLGVDLGTTFTAAAVHRRPRRRGARARQPRDAGAVGRLRHARTASPRRRGRRAARRGRPDPAWCASSSGGSATPCRSSSAARRTRRRRCSPTCCAWVVGVATERQGGPPDARHRHPPGELGRVQARPAAAGDRAGRRPRGAELCSEPEAAAIAYASRNRVAAGDRVAVYDLGGGTFDAAVLRRAEDGGSGWSARRRASSTSAASTSTRRCSGTCSARWTAAPGRSTTTDLPAVTALARLRRDCVEAKEALSSDTETAIPVEPARRHDDRAADARRVRGHAPAGDRRDRVARTRRVLRSAGLEPADLAAIVLVGGSSRIPLVSQLLSAEFGRPLALDTHPKHDVALGAALRESPAGRAGGRARRRRPSRPPRTAPAPVHAPPAPEPAQQPVPAPAGPDAGRARGRRRSPAVPLAGRRAARGSSAQPAAEPAPPPEPVPERMSPVPPPRVLPRHADPLVTADDTPGRRRPAASPAGSWRWPAARWRRWP